MEIKVIHKTQENILKQALELFMSKGYDGVTLQDILDKAELSKGAFYHYFKSKEECFEECVKYFLSIILFNDYHAFPSDNLREFIHALRKKICSRDYFKDSINMFTFANDVIIRMPKFLDYFNIHNKIELERWTEVVQNALDSGEISSTLPAESIAKLFISTCDGVALHLALLRAPREKSIEDIYSHWNSLYILVNGKNNSKL